MNTNREARTGRETFIPFLVFGPPEGSSTGYSIENYVKSQPSKPEPLRSDTSDPRGYNILTYQKSYDVFAVIEAWVCNLPVSQSWVRLLSESVINDTMISLPMFSIAGWRSVNTPVDETDSHRILDDSSEARVEAKELVTAFLEEVRTDETLERCELVISDIIDRYGMGGIAALQAEVFEAAVEPLAWKFLYALGARRGQPIDDAARAILLSHLDSTSAGRRSAAASALGSFPDRVVLTALERQAAIEKNRMVLATLNAHIRTLKRDAALSAAKIL